MEINPGTPSKGGQSPDWFRKDESLPVPIFLEKSFANSTLLEDPPHTIF